MKLVPLLPLLLLTSPLVARPLQASPLVARPLPARPLPASSLTSPPARAQKTEPGGVVTKNAGGLEGYTLVSDIFNDRALLVDMKGNTVNSWKVKCHPAKLLPGGYLLSGTHLNPKSPSANLDLMDVVELDWSGQEIWSFSDFDDQGTGRMMARQDHDLEREGSPVGYYAPGLSPLVMGRTLIMGHMDYAVPDISPIELQDDVLYEVNWDGTRTDFEWHAVDHIDEFGFSTAALLAIYSNPATTRTGVGDWLHMNSINYLGPNRWYDAGDKRFAPDNILVESRNASFMIIIDHETGEVVWRVGPDYSSGPAQALAFQNFHHGHMIPRGLPGEGNILVFDNGAATGYGPDGYPQYPARGYTRVVEFDPITLAIVWEYGAPSGPEKFNSPYMGSAQRLPNGNTFITSGNTCQMFEVTPKKEIVWSYLLRDVQGLYRAYKVPPEWLPAGVNPGGYPSWASEPWRSK